MGEEIIINETDFVNNECFEEGEIVLTVVGPRAPATTWEEIQTALTAVAGPPAGELYKTYRLEDPTKWYLTPEQGTTDSLIGKELKIEGKRAKILVTRKEEEKVKLRVLWVAPTLKLNTIERVLTQKLGCQVNASRPEIAKDRGRMDVEILKEDIDEESIPHYVQIATEKNGKKKYSLWLLPVLNRRQKCFYCSSETHWPSRCAYKTNRHEDDIRVERVLGRAAQRALPPPPTIPTRSKSYAEDSTNNDQERLRTTIREKQTSTTQEMLRSYAEVSASKNVTPTTQPTKTATTIETNKSTQRDEFKKPQDTPRQANRQEERRSEDKRSSHSDKRPDRQHRRTSDTRTPPIMNMQTRTQTTTKDNEHTQNYKRKTIETTKDNITTRDDARGRTDDRKTVQQHNKRQRSLSNNSTHKETEEGELIEDHYIDVE